MSKRINTASAVFFALLISLGGSLTGFPLLVYAVPLVDNNNGFWRDNYDDPVGLAINNNMVVENGSISLSACDGSVTQGDYTTTLIKPNSFSAWGQLTATGVFNANTLQIEVRQPGGGVILSGSGPQLDLSIIDPITNPELDVRVQMNFVNGNPCPAISDLQITWTPRSILLLDKSAPTQVQAGEVVTYKLRISVNWVAATGLVIWDTLPSFAAGTLIYPTEPSPTPYPGQNDDPVFQSATEDGQFTASGTTVNGVAIPANSVYWTITPDPATEGLTRNLSYSIKSKNGSLNSTILRNTAFADAANADAVQSVTTQTTIVSTPAPHIDKRAGAGILVIDDQEQAQVGSTIQFILADPTGLLDANDYAPIGRETMYNSVVWDDVSNLCPPQLTSVDCTTGAGFNNISGGGSFNPNFSPPDGSAAIPAIVWPTRTLTPGAGFYETFEVDVIGPVDGDILINKVCLDSDQTDAVCDLLTVKVGIDENPPRGIFAKGDDLNGSISALAGINDDRLLNAAYGDQYKYLLRIDNQGAVTVNDVLMLDRIPDDLDFVTASLPAAANGVIFYSTEATFTDPSTPPPVDITQAPVDLDMGGNDFWQASPPADPATVTWVAFYIPQVSSVWFPPVDPVSQVFAEITVQTGSEQCVAINIDNRGVFRAYNLTPLAGGPPQPIDDGPLEAFDDELTQIKPKIAEFNLQPSAVSLTPNPFEPPAQLDYTLTVSNIDSPTSDTATDIQVELNWNRILINGELTYPSFVSVAGGVVEILDPVNGRVVLNIGTLAPGESATIDLSLSVPTGVFDGETVTVNGTVSGDDALCDAPTFSLAAIAAGVVANPGVQVIKNDVVNLIEPGDEYDYSLTYNNIGPAPSTGTYLVDKLPDEVVFLSAELPNGEQLYCSAPPLDGALPAALSTLDQLDGNSIANYFSLGTEAPANSGVWQCPQGEQTSWIALLIDDPNLNPPQVPAGAAARIVTFTVRNDESRSGGDPDGSSVGTLIFNDVGVFSEQLIQSIANEVITTVSEQPGIELRKTGLGVIASGARFDWQIEYLNNSGADDTVAQIVDQLPLGVSFVSATHEWNAATLANDPSLPVGAQPIPATENGQVVTFAIAPEYRGGDLGTTEGGIITITVDASAALSSGVLLTNTACGTAENDLGTTPEVCDEDVVEVVNAELFLRKQVDNPAPRSGDTINYTLILSNVGRLDAENVVISDVLPTGLTYVGPTQIISPTGYTIAEPSINGQQLTWNSLTNTDIGTAGVLPAESGDIYISYAVQVDASVAPGTTLINDAQVTTTTPEDGTFPNDDDETVRTPFPDPTVNKTGPTLADPGSTVSWTVQYRNNNNEDAAGVYLIDSLPSFDADLDTDVTFVSTQAPTGVDVYYNATAGATPAFNINTPTSNDWSAAPTNPVNHIAYAVGALAREAGPFSITITVQLNDPGTGAELPSGAVLDNQVEIFSSTVDDDPNNNTDNDEVRTPGLDMAISKTGSSEGAFPGLAPGADLVYSFEYTNTGPVTAWGVRIVDNFPGELTLATPLDNFSNVTLQDASGNACTPVDASGNPITTAVPVEAVINGQQVTWFLGGQANYRNVGIPPGCVGRFEVFVAIDSDVADSTSVLNTVELVTDNRNNTEPPEEFLDNNTDDSQVTVYRTDLSVLKSVVDVPSGDEQFTDAGNILEYTIEYANLGNISAADAEINEIIPPGTTFVSLEPPPNSTVLFSPDADDPSEFTVQFNAPLPAPSTFFEQSQNGALISNALENISLDEAQLFVPWNGGDGFAFNRDGTSADFSTSLAAFDADGDSDLDVVVGNGFDSQQNELHLNNGNGVFSPWDGGNGFLFNGDGSHFRETLDATPFDADGDGDLDVAVANANEPNELHINQGGAQGGTQGIFQPWDSNEGALFNAVGNQESYSLVAFDADGDGDLDVAVGNRDADNELYLNQTAQGNPGVFTFAGPAFNGNSGAVTSDLIAFDADGDGDLDIGVANQKLNELHINQGGAQGGIEGIFQPWDGTDGMQFNGDGNNSTALAAFDADGDGDLDVAVASTSLNELHINQGGAQGGTEGIFQPWNGTNGALFNTIFGETRIITPFDVDNDGDIDVAVGNGLDGASLLFLNDGQGAFTPWDGVNGEAFIVPGFGNGDVYDLIAFDADGDGDLDVGVVHNEEGSPIQNRLFLNQSSESSCLVLTPDITRSEVLNDFGNQRTYSLAADDINGDGHFDVVVGNFNRLNELYLGNGDGTFQLGTQQFNDVMHSSPFSFTRSIILTDVNNDTFLDVLVGNTNQANELYLGNGDGTFQAGVARFNDFGNQNTQSLAAGDFNQDGNIDIVVANFNDSNELYLGNGNGTFQLGTTPFDALSARTFDVGVADFDNDNNLDVLMINSGSDQPNVLYLGNGDGTFQAGVIAASPATGFNFSRAHTIADFNGDGNLDIATSNRSDEVFLGNGDGSFQAPIMLVGQISSFGSAAADFNGDGLLDLAAVGNQGGFYPGNGDGTFETFQSVFATGGTFGSRRAIIGHDFDNNGIADALIGSEFAANELYLNAGLAANGRVTSPLITPTDLYPASGDLQAWQNLIVDAQILDQAAISYDILDSTGNPIPGFTDLSAPAGIISLAGLDVAAHPSIQVRANLSHTADNVAVTPKFCGWQVGFQMTQNPSFTFRVRVDDPVVGFSQIDNSVSISTATPETRTDNNADDDTIRLILADVYIEKQVDQAAAILGSTLTYTLDYGNNGPQTARNVTLSDTLPAGIAFGAFSVNPGCTENAGVIACNVGDLTVGATGQVIFTATVAAGTEGQTLINPTSIRTDTNETDLSNNDDSAQTVIPPAGVTFANVFINKEGPLVASLGELLVYNLSYGSSRGDAIGPATAVVVSDTLPADCTYDAANTTPTPSSINGQTLTWDFTTLGLGTPTGTLQPGETGTISVACQVSNDPGLINTELLNAARISTTDVEITASDNDDNHASPVALEPASISGFVWRDDNTDVVFDEPASNGLEDITVTLTGTDIFGNDVNFTTTTGSDGSYRFTGLAPGDYTLTETQPSDFSSTGSAPGSVDGNMNGTSNGPDQITGIVLTAGDSGINYNFGEARGTIGDRVWLDLNGDGQQDPGELGIASVTVSLLDSIGNAIAQMQTDVNGNYLFTDLPPDDYTVVVDTSGSLANLTNTGDPDGGPGGINDSRSEVTLGLGENNLEQDFGYQPDDGTPPIDPPIDPPANIPALNLPGMLILLTFWVLLLGRLSRRGNGFKRLF